MRPQRLAHGTLATLAGTAAGAAEAGGSDAAPATPPPSLPPEVERALQDPTGFLGDTVVDPARRQAEATLVRIDSVLAPQPAAADPATGDVQVAPEPVSALVLMGVALAAGAAAAGGTLLVFWLAGSSSVGAGTAASPAGAQLRRLLPFASPLFTRFERDTVLGHPKREQLYLLIMQEPGVSLQSLCDQTGLSRTAVTHHLRLLEHHHVVVSKRVGRSRHYYENGGRYGREQKEAYAVLQNDRSKQVAEFIRTHPGAIQKTVCDALGLNPSIAHWHVRRLAEAQLVQAVRHGRTVSYFPTPGLEQTVRPAIPSAAIPA
ncbi:MAG TPA: winged helix-turn-helix transcriptional regulator [Candidatus Thermoplasmatota archaeon]|nr:winged helix-turn-helix transcriptional regulator [Candidatus Thermoplasmatota archaeon]